MRVGNTFTGPAIPPPAAGVANAVPVTVGGAATGVGAEVTWHAILSDGLGPFAWGNPLLVHDLDGRGVLVTAHADLDGDGRVGSWSGDGNADAAVETQEAIGFVGRQLGLLSGGVSQGTMALQVGLPASVGGLGVVVDAGALTGTTPPLYGDGPWIATMLPFVPPDDVLRLMGGGAGGAVPGPTALVVLEASTERLWVPSATDPLFADALAIPLDGTSPTVDLLRVISGPATGLVTARDVAGGFAPALDAPVRPAIGAAGERRVVELVDALTLANDAAGQPQTLLAYPGDLFANAADVPPGGLTVTLEAGLHLRILAPDTDGDPRHETLTFTTPRAVALVVDGAGTGSVTNVTEYVVATRAGVPAGVLRVDLGTGGPTPTAGELTPATSTLRLSPDRTRGRITLGASFVADPAALDVATSDMDLDVRDAGGPLVAVSVRARDWRVNRTATTFSYRDPSGTARDRIASLRVKRVGSRHDVKVKLTYVDLRAVPASTSSIDATVTLGTTPFTGTLTCSARSATLTCIR
jgi:hypothetical protein